MANYELTFKKSVAKDLRRIPNKDVAQILTRIRSLADNPRPHDCEKLSGQERYRVRCGDYRVVYQIEDHRLTVLVIKVGHRGEVYRKPRR